MSQISGKPFKSSSIKVYAIPLAPGDLALLSETEDAKSTLDPRSLGASVVAYADVVPDPKSKRYGPELVIASVEDNHPRTHRYKFGSSDPDTGNYIFDPLVSPYGNRIVFKYGRTDGPGDAFGLYAFSVLQKKVVKLVKDFLRDRETPLSPDGRHLACFVAKNSVHLMLVDTAAATSTEVASGDSILGPTAWISKNEFAYSQLKRHTNGTKSVLQPVLYAYNVETKTRRILIDRAAAAKFATDGQQGIYQGLHFPNGEYREDNVSLRRFDSDGKVPANEISSPDKFIQVNASVWDENSKRFLLVSSALDQTFRDPAKKLNRTIHRIYSWTPAASKLETFAFLTLMTPWEGSDLTLFTTDSSRNSLVVGIKSVSEKINPLTTLTDRICTFKSYNSATQTWEDVYKIEGAFGVSGATADKTIQNSMRY